MNLTPCWATPEQTSKAVETLVNGKTGRSEEAEIIRILSNCPSQDLEYAALHLDLRRLISSVDDHRTGKDNRTRLLRLLTRTRIQELSVKSRARLIDALQHRRTDELKERAIVALFLATKGVKLTRLKELVDGGQDQYDLQHLMENDLDETHHHRALWAHFAKEANSSKKRPLKLLSDIDDTVYANWKDARYPAKTVYPGVVRFYTEISQKSVTFLTARPGERTGRVKLSTHNTLRNLGLHNAVVLVGAVQSLTSNSAIAELKFQNFEFYAKLYPEYDFLFLGDTGQGDGLLGQRMLKNYPTRVRAVLLHDVVGLRKKAIESYASQGIKVFRTYPAAAKTAQRLKLLSEAQRRAVATQALSDFAEIEFADSASKELLEGWLKADCAR